jgi:hypothetical protein
VEYVAPLIDLVTIITEATHTLAWWYYVTYNSSPGQVGSKTGCKSALFWTSALNLGIFTAKCDEGTVPARQFQN